jgi:hypothetical protein
MRRSLPVLESWDRSPNTWPPGLGWAAAARPRPPLSANALEQLPDSFHNGQRLLASTYDTPTVTPAGERSRFGIRPEPPGFHPYIRGASGAGAPEASSHINRTVRTLDLTFYCRNSKMKRIPFGTLVDALNILI